MTILLLSLTAAAQRYPVTVTPTLLPPYTLNLSELTAPASARLMATITVNDLTASNLPVRLHFKLESTGITIESIKTAAVAPLFLGGGETLVLTGSDMAQYLRLDNLDFRGYSKEQYRQTGQLPGGMWRLTVEVHHFYNHRVLSNRGSQTAWISIYDPPELTTPRNGTEAPDNASLPLIFNWQPSKHTGGTEAVQYKLQVWEMRMQGVPAQTVAANMTPIFETTTAATTYTAIPAAMNLEPGMRYCWRVTVFDPSGKALINKNGQSEVREFTYLHTCPAVDEVSATVHNARVDFSWTPAPYHTHFQVELVGDNGVSELNDCYDSQFKLYDFPRGSTWKVRVRGECSGGLEADWSPWRDFEIDPPGTPPTPEECPNCGCDDAPKPRAITNYELKELHEGDTIENRTGRTRFIVLTAVPNGDGSYNGQFYIWLELWKTKVRCDYTDLKVNTDGVIFDGQWRSVRNDGLMVNPAAVAEAIESIKNNVAAATYDNYIRDTVKFTYPIQTIYKDQNDNYIAVLADGTELDVTQRLSNAGHTLIEDSEGNQMAVTGDHRLMSAEQYHKTGKNNTLLKNDSQTKDKQIAASGDVIFKPSSNQQYGFDAYDASTNNHPEIYPLLEGGSYRPAYKSVAQWQQDKVTAEPMQGVTFRNQMGVPYATTSDDIILRGEPQPGETPVYAHVAETDSTTKVVGKLNLLTFEPREINVCLVPVNGATPPNAQTLEKELNKIFKPAVASVKVSTHSGITIDYADGSGFVHGGSGPLTVYSDDEKAAINALTDANDDTYYLFLVSSVTKLDADGNRTIVSGYMPVGYQHGFIFEQFNVVRTYAHELSHGAFALHHTFSANTESFRADEGTTTNLMDYTQSGTTLNHKQWTWMHEKHGSGLFGFLADESEGEAKLALKTKEGKGIAIDMPNYEKEYCFLTPSLVPIWLKPVTDIRFFDNGTVSSFVVDGKKYSAVLNNDETTFFFYYEYEDFIERQGKTIENLVLSQDLDNSKIYTHYQIAQSGDKVLAFADYSLLGIDCKQIVTYTNTNTYDKIVGSINATGPPEDATPIKRIGSCKVLDLADSYQLDGLGRDFFLMFYDGCSAQSSQIESLVSFCREINDYENDNCKNRKHHITNAFAEQLKESGINTIDRFRDNYYIGIVLGSIVISKDDLWRDLSEDYNSKSNHEYSLSELKLRYKLLRDGGPLATGILNMEEEGNAQPLTTEAYVNKYGDASSLVAFIMFFELESNLVSIEAATNVAAKASKFFKTTKTKRFTNESIQRKKDFRAVERKRILDDISKKQGNNGQDFLNDFANATYDELKALEQKPELVDAWSIIKKSHPVDCKKINVLQKVDELRKLPGRENVGFTDDVITDIKGVFYVNNNASTIPYEEVLETCSNFVKSVSKHNIDLGNFSTVIGDLTKGQSFTAGAEWTVRYIGQNGREFAGKKLRFEVNQEVGDKIRRVDMVVEDDILGNIFYEFKSVKDVPPANFLEQFGKDLKNTDVSDLSQIKWIFDGKKVSQQQLTDAIKKTIDEWKVPEDVLNKWGYSKYQSDVFKTEVLYKDEIYKEIFKSY